MTAKRLRVVAVMALLGLFVAAAVPGAGYPHGLRLAADTTPPTVMPITATFNRPVTTYTVIASDKDGDTLHYSWSKQQGTPCGVFTAGDQPYATWSHPDADFNPPGDCPAESIHAGTITVKITDGGHWVCTAVDPNGSAATTGLTATCVQPDCDKEKLAVAQAKGKVAGLQQALDTIRSSQVDPAMERLDKAIAAVLSAAQAADHPIRAFFGGYSGAVRRQLNEAEAELAAAQAALQKAAELYKQVGNQLKQARMDLDAAEKALEKCLNGGSARHVAAAGGSRANATATACGSQLDALTTARATLGVLTAVEGRLAGTGVVKAPAELGRAVASLGSLDSTLRASVHGHAAAQSFGAALAKVKGAQGLVKSSAAGPARIGTRAASAKSQAGKAQAALATCKKGH